MPSSNVFDPTNHTALLSDNLDRWHSGNGSVTYSILSEIPDYYYDDGERGYVFDEFVFDVGTDASLTAVQATMADTAIMRLNEVANINISATVGNGVGDITFGALDFDDPDLFGFAYFPGGDELGGDVWLNTASPFIDNATFYDEGWVTFTHELGHAVGLDHPFDGTRLPGSLDNSLYTIMSYDPVPAVAGDPAATRQFPATPMLYDIQALQVLYGANMGTRTGDDVYFAGSAGGLQIGDGGSLIATIWDAGGNDTFSAANQTASVDIDLRPGHFSTIGSVENNIGIAYGTGQSARARSAFIENATGGSADDKLRGNSLDNMLNGGDGNDTLNSSAGDDILNGGNGDDTLRGGNGSDLLRGGNGNDDGSGDDGDDRLFGNGGTDILRGKRGDDKLNGGDDNDTLYGGGGRDIVIGGNGDDLLYGGSGADVLDGGSGNDRVSYDGSSAVTVNLATGATSGGQAGGDTFFGIESIVGSAFADALTGDAQSNTFRGGNGADTIFGGDGEDVLDGGNQNDTLVGQTGDDVLLGRNGNDTLRGGEGSDTLRGGGNDDLLIGGADGDALFGGNGDDTLRGSQGSDTLRGGSDDDRLFGGTGDDRLLGEGGVDVLNGGRGDDILTGGAQRDTFVFDDRFDDDRITDFDRSENDRIEFSAGGGAVGAVFARGDTTFTQGTDTVVVENIDLTGGQDSDWFVV